jgi:hypothetical protein
MYGWFIVGSVDGRISYNDIFVPYYNIDIRLDTTTVGESTPPERDIDMYGNGTILVEYLSSKMIRTAKRPETTTKPPGALLHICNECSR